MTIRPFTADMKFLADEVYKYISKKIFDGELIRMLCQEFNSLTILLYYNKTDDGKIKQIGMHRDQLYDDDGNLNVNQNSQAPYTPTVILTIGDPRILKFELSKHGNMEHFKHIEIHPIKLLNATLFILHPLDEVPRKRPYYPFNVDDKTFFRHGKVNFGGANDCLSVAFVFRTVNRKLKIGKHGKVYHRDSKANLDDYDHVLNTFFESMLKLECDERLQSVYEQMKRRYNYI